MSEHTRGKYRKDYISPRRDGSFQYQRWVPLKLQPLIGRTAWTRWLGNKGRATAEQRARELAVEHDRLIASLSALTPAERQQIASAGGWAAWQAADKLISTAQPGGFFKPTMPPVQYRPRDAELGFARLAAELEPDPDMPDDMVAQSWRDSHKARERVARLEAEAAAAKRLARKVRRDEGFAVRSCGAVAAHRQAAHR